MKHLNEILLTAYLLLFPFCSLSVSAYNNSSRSTVEHCKKLEKLNEGKIKELEKQYNAKVSIERWEDGNTYYIINRNGKFARADMDGCLISYKEYGSSEKFSFFKAFQVQKLKTGDYYYLALFDFSPKPYVCLSNGVWIYTPYTPGGFRVVGDRKYLTYYSGSGKSAMFFYYDMDGRLINKSPIKGCGFYGMQDTAMIVTDQNRIPIKFIYPKTDVVLNYDSSIRSPKTKTFGHIVSDKLGDVDVKWAIGNLYASYFNGVKTSETTLRHHFNPDGKVLGTDTVLTVEFPEPINLIQADNGDTLIRNADKISLLHNSDIIYYNSYDSDSFIPRTGMISTRNRGNNVPPRFNDIYVDGNKTMVKMSASDHFTQYDREQNYEKSFSDSLEIMLEKGFYKDVLLKLERVVADGKRSLSGRERQILNAAYSESVGQDLADQYHLICRLRHNSKNLHSDGYTIAPNDSTLNCSISDNVLFYAPLMAHLDNRNGGSDSLLLALTANDIIIDSEYILYKQRESERLEQQRIQSEEAAKRREIERQKRERLRKALEASRKNREFVAEIKKYQNIVNSAQKKSAGGSGKQSKAIGKPGSSTVTNATSAGGSSTDNSGRKAFLRGQIADWKNKLKKAEDSYRQALSSGDDSWEKKCVIDSKRNTVDECLNMIREFESELNSLK